MSSGPATSADGRIQKPAANGQGGARSGPERRSIVQQIQAPEFLGELKRALPSHMRPEKMLRVYLTVLKGNPALLRCTPESFFGALMQSAQLGLEPNTPNGHCWLIPYKDQCQLIVGYQGQIELALRSGKVEKLWTRTVREGDDFQVKYGLEEDIVHIPSTDPDRESRPITYVYGVAALTTGGKVFEVLSLAQVEARRKRSASGRSGPWQTDFEAMARKTAVRSLFKWIPKSSEMALAEALENRADEGKSQGGVFDSMVNESIERMGMQPIVDVEGVETPHDSDGVVAQQEEPGANG